MNQLEQQAIRAALREIYDGRSLCVDESIADEQIDGALRIVCKHLDQAQHESATQPPDPK